MDNIKSLTIKYENSKNGGNEYKVIEVNVSDPTECLYAICTPIKMQ
ncbi:hypothetical protein [Bacillus sp. Marseille-P3661]|nr:hypothetical protein [Bacillus sp. Marseille-P3661]